MNLATQLERDLFDSLSPEHQVEVEDHYAALETDAPNECPNCNAVIGDHDSFCSEECERQFNGAAELMSRPDFVLDEDKLRDQEQDR